MPSSSKKKSGKRQSGNPARRNVTSVKDWKRSSTAEEIPLPSGKVCLANRIGMVAFLQQGAIPDYLTPIVQRVIREKRYLPPEKEKELATDPVAALKTQEMLDRALVMTVVEPKVHMPPGCAECGMWLNFNDDDRHNRKSEKFEHDFEQEELDEDLLYADEVDLVDKMFLFQWSVGGRADLNSFREQYAESLERMASLTETEDPSESVARA